MGAFSRILIDVDAMAEAHPALTEAAAVAAACGATVKIVDVVEEVPRRARRYITPALESSLEALRKEHLAAVAAGVTQVVTSTGVLRGRPATAIVQEVLRSDHDLVVRSHGRDLDEGGRLLGVVDMELLRVCPCPIWLVGSQKRENPTPRILAAVHANPTDRIEQRLNNSILELALTMQALQGAQLWVVQAWTAFGESLLKSRMSADEIDQYVEAARAAEQGALSALTQPFSDRLQGATVELVKGEPDDVIADYVARQRIDLVVMGTVARGGLGGVLMGNTAERMLRRLRVSVLATKPPGFKSPVRKPKVSAA